MAHKTLVDGTAYEITGGKTLVGGTAYSIAGGKTMVDGTVYDISFGHPLITFNLNLNSLGVPAYQAEEGMTWTEFVNSKYNVDGKFRIKSEQVHYYYYTNQFGAVATGNSIAAIVSPSDVITAYWTYVLK